MAETDDTQERWEPVRSFDRTGWEEVIFELAEAEPESREPEAES